jgi:alpha-L-rhamnosidase
MLEVTIPANTTATVTLPGPDPARITEGKRPLSSAKGVTDVHAEAGATVCTIGSGTYRFTVER